MNNEESISISSARNSLGTYKGEVGSYLRRKVSECEWEWNVDAKEGLGPFSFDQLLLDALQNAIQQGRSEIVVLDFGCGEAELFKGFLNTPESESRAKTFIKQQHMKIKLIGITDITGLMNIPEDASVNTVLPIQVPLEESSSFEAYRILYGVTAAQTLENCLQTQGITSIDLSLATHSLNYFSVQNFEQIVETIANHLTKNGGKFIGASYNTRLPGFRRAPLAGAELDIPERKTNTQLQDTLSNSFSPLYLPNVDIDSQIKNFAPAISLYKRLGVLSDDSIQKIIDEALPLRKKVGNFLQRKKASLPDISSLKQKDALWVLQIISIQMSKAEEMLYQSKQKINDDGKQKFLEKLKEQYPGLHIGKSVFEIST